MPMYRARFWRVELTAVSINLQPQGGRVVQPLQLEAISLCTVNHTHLRVERLQHDSQTNAINTLRSCMLSAPSAKVARLPYA